MLILEKPNSLHHIAVIVDISGNSSVKELDLSDNINGSGKEAFHCETTLEGKPESSETNARNTEPSPLQMRNNLCVINHEYGQLEVADSEDERVGQEPDPFGMDRSCASSSGRVCLLKHQLIEELSAAISLARQLELLDLSNNWFSSSDMELFYASWAKSRIVHPALRHVDGQVFHLSVRVNRCCRVKPCCKRD